MEFSKSIWFCAGAGEVWIGLKIDDRNTVNCNYPIRKQPDLHKTYYNIKLLLSFMLAIIYLFERLVEIYVWFSPTGSFACARVGSKHHSTWSLHNISPAGYLCKLSEFTIWAMWSTYHVNDGILLANYFVHCADDREHRRPSRLQRGARAAHLCSRFAFGRA